MIRSRSDCIAPTNLAGCPYKGGRARQRQMQGAPSRLEPVAAIGYPPAEQEKRESCCQSPPERQNKISYQPQDRKNNPKDFSFHLSQSIGKGADGRYQFGMPPHLFRLALIKYENAHNPAIRGACNSPGCRNLQISVSGMIGKVHDSKRGNLYLRNIKILPVEKGNRRSMKGIC